MSELRPSPSPLPKWEGEITLSKPLDADPRSWVDGAPLRLKPWLRLMRLDRPIGTWLLFWPCVFGLILGAMAEDRPFTETRDVVLLVLFGVGAIVMRGAGCTYNDIVDRDIDARVARTKDRPIPSGAVRVRDAWLFLGGQCLLGLLILIALNPFSVVVGAASLVLIAAYPFMKRITWWPQAWLGLTFNWGALLGFAAETGRIDWADATLYAGLVFWTLGYDTIYAHQDKEDDALVGVKSTARLFGPRSRDWILGFYSVAFALILAAGYMDHAGWPFTLLMLAAGGHLLWQVRTLDIDNPQRCLKLFRANRDTGAMIAAAFLIASWAG
jgi:4-hydroxybenzoate polyprenyltransferase